MHKIQEKPKKSSTFLFFSLKICVHEHAQVAVGRGVAVEEDGAGFFEEFVAQQQAVGHEQQIGFHSGRVRAADNGAEVDQVFVFVADVLELVAFDVFDGPFVRVLLDGVAVFVGGEAELVGFRFTFSDFAVFAHLAGIEGRVGDDGVGDVGVQAEHHFPVIADEDSSVLAVEFHFPILIRHGIR